MLIFIHFEEFQHLNQSKSTKFTINAVKCRIVSIAVSIVFSKKQFESIELKWMKSLVRLVSDLATMVTIGFPKRAKLTQDLKNSLKLTDGMSWVLFLIL